MAAISDPLPPFSKRSLAFLVLAIVLSRLPLVLGGGFGSDDDSWRNVVAALHSRELGHYVPSRLPGFPVFDAILILLVPLGPWGVQLAAALAQALAAVSFFRVAARVGIVDPWPATLAFAFGPSLWVSGTQAMDYAFGLAGVLAAYDAALARRPLRAAAFLALATGCRPVHALLGLPLGLLIGRREGRGPAARYVLLWLIATALLFAPVLATIPPALVGAEGGRHVSRSHVTAANALPVIRGAVVYALGKLGAVAVALGAGAAVLRRRRAPAARPDRATVVFECGALALYAAAYLLVPLDPAYLIPAVPFLLLLAARLLSRGWMTVAALAAASEVLVMPLAGGRRLAPGRLALERAARESDLAATHALAAERPARPEVLVVGRFATHRLLVLDPSRERTAAGWAPFLEPTGIALWTRDRRLGVAAFLTPAQRESLGAAGYRVSARDAPPR